MDTFEHINPDSEGINFEMSDKDFKALLDHTLTGIKIRLCYEKLSDFQAKRLAKALADPACNIVKLSLIECDIGIEGGAAIANALPNTKITHLSIMDETCDTSNFIRSVPYMHQLEHLNIYPINFEYLPELNIAIQLSNTLCDISPEYYITDIETRDKLAENNERRLAKYRAPGSGVKAAR